LLLPRWVRPNSSPCSDHRDALGQQQRGEQVALLPLAQRDHGRVVGVALGAAVPGAVVVSPSLLSSPLASLCLSL
jgi:hypothetical protein